MQRPTKVQALAHAVAAYQILRNAMTETHEAEAAEWDHVELRTGRNLRMKDLRRLTTLQYQLDVALEECLKTQMTFSFDNWDDRRLLERCLRELRKEADGSYANALGLLVVGREADEERDRMLWLRETLGKKPVVDEDEQVVRPRPPRSLLEFIGALAYGGGA